MEQQTHIQFLLRQYIINAASPAQQAELMLLLQTSDYDEEQLLQLLDEIALATAPQENYDPAYWRPKLLRILQAAPVVQMQRRQFNWKKIAIAASILLIISLGSYFAFFNNKKHNEIAKVETKDVPAPDRTRASITLADGRTIYLDSLNTGTIATQNQVTITKDANGNIVYTPSAVSTPTAFLNTLTNPRGSKVIDMTLADGSRVWLNAGSSITYPIAFISNERKVSITGEAYFTVTHNEKQPFTVSANGVDIHDLGTSFNVNAYSDESDVKVTLLEGSVKVMNDVDTKTIKPGEQISAVSHSPLTIHHSPDTEQAIAWKNNRFIFAGENIQSVMRQLARWYDVDVNYNGTIPTDEFVGVISRSRYENISAVLNMLEKTKTVSFKIEGRRITVQPWKQ